MLIGVPRETKPFENRVSLTPREAGLLKEAGHDVLVQFGAGLAAGFLDEQYVSKGADLTHEVEMIWGCRSRTSPILVVKVKEPQPDELPLLRSDCPLITFIHPTSNPAMTSELVRKEITTFAYETIQTEDGAIPILVRMSQIAGQRAPELGQQFSANYYGGTGVLASPLGFGPQAYHLVIGAGIVGRNAVQRAKALGAYVVVTDTDPAKLGYIGETFGLRGECLIDPTQTDITDYVRKANVIIGGVHVTGEKTPVVLTYEQIKQMQKGAVLIDVSIDNGGCTEASTVPTTHANPIRYMSRADPTDKRVIHTLAEAREVYGDDFFMFYGVQNMPGDFGHTSTLALTDASYPYVLALANANGDLETAIQNHGLRTGLCTHDGRVYHPGAAEVIGRDCSVLP